MILFRPPTLIGGIFLSCYFSGEVDVVCKHTTHASFKALSSCLISLHQSDPRRFVVVVQADTKRQQIHTLASFHLQSSGVDFWLSDDQTPSLFIIVFVLAHTKRKTSKEQPRRAYVEDFFNRWLLASHDPFLGNSFVILRMDNTFHISQEEEIEWIEMLLLLCFS